MKNIHILPTDKPSRLAKSTKSGLNATKKGEGLYESGRFGITTFNIYITNDEEIKEGVNQWYLDKFLNKPRNSSGSQYGEKQDVIILTTDQDLIKDGVQEIPEYFLIHYIVGNNPIEYVEIKEHLKSIDTMKINYELIIPKEEPYSKVQQKSLELNKKFAENNDLEKIMSEFDEPKQETFEEARVVKRSYSEEDMKIVEISSIDANYIPHYQTKEGQFLATKFNVKQFKKK